MAGALPGHRVAHAAREPHRLDHVVGAVGDHDRGRLLVDGQVPGQAGLVPAGVARGEDVTGDAAAKRCELLDSDGAHVCGSVSRRAAMRPAVAW